MKVAALAVSAVLMALGAACADASEPVFAEVNDSCHGRPSPVDEEEIVRTLGRYGFELYREDLCSTYAPESPPAAMYTNIPAPMLETPTADVVFASDSQIWCDLYRGDRFGSKVKRSKTPDVDETYVQVLNVECTIYPASPWHTERLALAAKQLLRDAG